MNVYPKERFISLLMQKEIPKNRKRAEAERFVPFFLQFYPFFCALYPERARERKNAPFFCSFCPIICSLCREETKKDFLPKGLVWGVYILDIAKFQTNIYFDQS